MLFKYFNLFCVCLMLASCVQKKTQSENTQNDQYFKIPDARLAAEWEPALGTIISWPLSVPHQLAVELSRDYQLYVMVENDSTQADAVSWFQQWEMDTSRVHFIQAPQSVDASWLRDWGPHAVFSADGSFQLANPYYINSTPLSGRECGDSLSFIFTKPGLDGQIVVDETSIENQAPHHIGRTLNHPVTDLPFVFTGGNIMTDGLGNAMSSCIIVNENQYNGLTKEEFLKSAEQLLGIRKYDILPNFEPRGIQHIDCLLKVLDEDRILVARPPQNHPERVVYDSIAEQVLPELINAYGRPYQILRLDTDRYEGDKIAAYTNSLIINKHIYVPLFGIAQDSVALSQWRSAMPGYSVKGFEFNIAEEPALSDKAKTYYTSIGWTFGDALHCRTRAVWDPEMIFITVNKRAQISATDKHFRVYATVIDYGSVHLIPSAVEVSYRQKGETQWQISPMTKDGSAHAYVASFPISVGTYEYFVTARSKSGKTATRPAVAPNGFFEVTVAE